MDTKLKADIAETAVTAKLLRRGLAVLRPVGDRLSYDLAVDTGYGRILRLQVKSAWKQQGAYLVDNRRTKTNRRRMLRTAYCREDFDFAALYIDDLDITYIMPVDVFTTYKSGISLVEGNKRQRKPRSYAYREAWHLLVAAQPKGRRLITVGADPVDTSGATPNSLRREIGAIFMVKFLLVTAGLLFPAVAWAEPVTDPGTEIRELIIHEHPDTNYRPLLPDLMHAFERPGRAEPVGWAIVAASEQNAAVLRERLRYRGLDAVTGRTRFLIDPERFDTWARDVYEIEGLRSVPGGDITADDAFVYLGEKSEAAADHLEKVFQRKVLILPGEDAHQDRYHMPLGVVNGRRTSLLADPLSALEILMGLSEEEKLQLIAYYIKHYDWQDPAETRRQFESFFTMSPRDLDNYRTSPYVKSLDKVEAVLRAQGIQTVRIPTLHRDIIKEAPLPLGLYYINLVQDTYRDLDGGIRRKAVLASYGIGPLDTEARRRLEALGHFQEIRMVEAVPEGFRGGGIRCLLRVAGDKITTQ
ncbi:MAG: group I intron-associated PD-(D/E)XK endonuclease [Candidatus Omnitrophota bacterium]|nr:group I intron-associated PD-(D/E)XK endonuclease [Candidatus Omnitrophota bacterium]